jgi:molybdate transport system substrate-binding protein
MRTFLSLLATLTLVLVGACSTQRERDEGPVVLAAASLQDALSEAALAWTNQGHAEPVLSFAATPALARQIEAGAPADLFLSADEQWMDYLAGGGHIKGQSRRDLLGNSLVLVGPATDGKKQERLDARKLVGLLGQGRLALADPQSVPAGRYARQALESLGVWDDVSVKVIPAENVRLALELVARKDAAHGVVYLTDAQAQPEVQVLHTFAAGHHAPIRYPAALVSQSANADAEDFLAFLSSSETSAIFRRHGFTVPDAR